MMKRLHPAYLLVLLVVGTLLAGWVSLGIGSTFLSPSQVIAVLMGEPSKYAFIVENLRVPRVLIALFAGAGLAVSGAILQAIVRNPLASPDVIGITKGAGLAAVIVIVLFPGSPVAVLPVSAFAGAALVAVALMLFAYKGGARPTSLALIGLALGAICQAGTEYLLVKFPGVANDTLLWLTGSLWGRGWDEIFGLLPWFVILIPLVVLLTAKLDVLHLGDDVAAGLGEKTKRVRYLLLAVSVALAGVCVATVGSIGFVGLVAPHMARRIVGVKHKYMLPVSALCGALLLLVADSLGRGLVPPTEIPAGILTAVIGAPYFLYLLRRQSKQ